MKETGPSQNATVLRRAFDESFAALVPPAKVIGAELLLVRVQSIDLAVRASEVGAVSRCPRLTLLPSRCPSVVGLAGLRGGLVVVHSLADLIGEPRGKLDERAFLLLCAGDSSVGLLADELLGHMQVEPDRIHAEPGSGSWASAIVSLDSARHPLASIPALLAAIRQASSIERSSDEV